MLPPAAQYSHLLKIVPNFQSLLLLFTLSPLQNLLGQRFRTLKFSSTRLMGKQITIKKRQFPPTYPISIFWPVTSIWVYILWPMTDIQIVPNLGFQVLPVVVPKYCHGSLPGPEPSCYSLLFTHTGLLVAILKYHVFSLLLAYAHTALFTWNVFSQFLHVESFPIFQFLGKNHLRSLSQFPNDSLLPFSF